MPRNNRNAVTEQRPASRDLRILKRLFSFLRPYRSAVLGAAVALLIAAGAVLGFGVVLQRVVDHGLSSGSGAALNQALLLFLVVVTVMAASPVRVTSKKAGSSASTRVNTALRMSATTRSPIHVTR